MKLLFILKNRMAPYSGGCSYSEAPFSSGLFNSVQFVADMLRSHGVDVVVESVVDNNCIDRVVTEHRPTLVIIEALWVVPSKFEVLRKLHPRVKWAVRLHSEIPFIACEGVAMEWLRDYAMAGITILVNSRRMAHDLGGVGYTPNVYPLNLFTDWTRFRHPGELNVGCFGALRPLKNQLAQAVAAIHYAEKHAQCLRFHINGTRSERGDTVLHNLRGLFADRMHHQLVEHPWLDHTDFRRLMRGMDLLMQVSFSETYNIVAADAVSQLVPTVASKEVPFVASPFVADPTSVDSMVRSISRALRWGRKGARFNRMLLRRNVVAATREWLRLVTPR